MKILNRYKRVSGSGNCLYWYLSIKYQGRNVVQVKRSRFIVARILGKPLPKGSIVHHIKESLNDRPKCLVLCENDAYHKLLHLRTEALKMTGGPCARKCSICGEWGVPGEGDFVRLKRSRRAGGDGTFRHRSCHTKREKERRATRI